MPTISVNGTRLHYLDDGPRGAPAVVCSPSMFFDGRMFAAQADALSDRYRVIRYDHRGQGQSGRHPREQLDMDTLTADAAALIEELQLGPVTFVGNSMGGFVALRLGARRPDLVRRGHSCWQPLRPYSSVVAPTVPTPPGTSPPAPRSSMSYI